MSVSTLSHPRIEATELMAPVRVCDSKFDEEQRQQRKDRCLHESNECFESHKWCRDNIRSKIGRNRDEHLTGKDVAKKTK